MPELNRVPILLAACAAIFGGCQSVPKTPKEVPPDIPKVKVDAQNWADGSQQGVVEQMKRERQQQIRNVIDQRRDFGGPAPTEAGNGGRTLSSQTIIEPSQHPGPSRHPGASPFPGSTVSFNREQPRQAYGNPANDRQFAQEPRRNVRLGGRVEPTQPANGNRQVAQPAQQRRNRSRILIGDSPASNGAPSATSQGLHMKAVIRANGRRTALLHLAEGDVVRTAVGDSFEVNLDGSLTDIHVVDITDDSVRIRYNGKMKVLR